MDTLINTLKNSDSKNLENILNSTDISILHDAKLYLDDLYYNTSTSVVSDANYDLLVDILKQRDTNYVPKVGASLRKGENRVELPFWMGSVDKITPKDPAQLNRWLLDNKASSYVISEKLDGVSCLICYPSAGSPKLYTRGDGLIGADISYIFNNLRIPRSVKNMCVRGELIMKRKNFTKYANEYRNPRNMVAGIAGAKTLRAGIVDIDFIPYEIVSDGVNMSPEKQMKYLKSLGFTVVKHEIVNDLSINSLEEKYKKFKTESEYDIDGIIVQSNVEYERNTSGNPEYMFAFKMLLSENIHNTTVKYVEWNVSKWGQLKPVLVVEPVILEDITIQRVTAHNAKYIEDNNIGTGTVIAVTRSKDVIPYIVQVISSTQADMPDVEYKWDKNHVNIFTTENNDVSCVRLLANFFDKLSIKHVSEATVAKMYAAGFDNLLKIIAASKEDLLRIPEFGDKSAERIYTNIRNGLKNVSVEKLIGSSGVLGYGIGERRVKSLLADIPDIFTKKYDKKELLLKILRVEGFADLTAEKIVENVPYAILLLKKLEPYVTVKKKEIISSNLKGNIFVFSGFRDISMKENIEARGGKVTESVSNKTTAVIYNGTESSKVLKAKELGKPVYLKEEFLKVYGI